MSRKRNSENPVSLFAFQDIITSITGIMVLVVLLIILDIIDHADAESSNAPSAYQEEITKLEVIEKELQETLDKDKEWLTKNQDLIVQALSVDLSSLPKMIAKERNNNLKLSTAIENMEQECLRLEGMVLKTKGDILKTKIAIQEKNENIGLVKKKVANNEPKIRELAAKIKKLKEESEKRKNYVEIRTSDDLKESPVFVECSEAKIKTKVIKTSKLRDFKNDQHDVRKLLTDFYNWLKKTRNAEKECMVVIVKPSAAEFATTLVTILRQEGFRYNMEPMEENKTGVYE